MKKLNLKKLIVPGIYLVAVLSVFGCVGVVVSGINKYLTEKIDYTYTINGLNNNKVVPVHGGENSIEVQNEIIRPYKGDNIIVGRYFYDFEADEKMQENSIIFYEDTYVQNSGVDYISESVFDIVSVLDGKVLSVEKDDVLGNIIKVDHGKDVITVYEGIDDISLKIGDEVRQGDLIGKSSTSKVNSNYTTSLHFEVYYKGSLIDPESFYDLKFMDL